MKKAEKTAADLDKVVNQLFEGDCLEYMNRIPDGSVDMILCDLPYGMTQNQWDCYIPLEELWKQYNRVIKPNGAIVLTSNGVFTAKLILSQPGIYKYKWVWEKSKPTNFLNAKKQPLRKHEDVCVFYKKQPVYHPQMTKGEPYDKGIRKNQLSGSYGDFEPVHVASGGERYPTDIIYVKTAESEGAVLHPTQKPIELGRYMIRTYTNPGDIVLDNTFGSGSFLVAALMEGRNFIGIEKNENVALFKKEEIDYIDVAKKRLFSAWEQLDQATRKYIKEINLISEFKGRRSMGTIIRRNERSWAIVIISEIRAMLGKLDLRIKSAGGESTLSVNKKSMFPDVLLYEDEAQNKILQGWELKMPDVSITDEALIKDAARKAEALGLNSFVIWNFTYGKLYVKNGEGAFEEAKVWSGTNHIKSRDDVALYKTEWLPVIKDIVLTVNDFLVSGTICTSSIEATISDGLMTEIIQRNKEMVAEKLAFEVSRNMEMESRLKVWWKTFHEEYDKDESSMYLAYAKSILLNWINRIMFANTIKKYHNCARRIELIDNRTTPGDGNMIIDEIIKEGDFYNVFKKLEYNDVLPEETWIDIVDYNQFLIENKIEKIDQTALQEILEKTVHTAKREIRGQFATPYYLADLLCQITVRSWNDECADLCAGTGTIAKAVIKNKTERLHHPKKAFETTWIADKFAYPLQIANIAVTNIEALNIPLNIFQSDVFSVDTGDKVEIRSPVDGSKIEKEIPAFGAIVSNLPFVEYNKIALDEIDFILEYKQEIKSNTGITFNSGKTDLYNFIPFKLHELLADNGRLGVILSNSWLGTDIGKKFFNALEYYYHIHAVVMSNRKRWFHNADVVAVMLILEKKKIDIPDSNGEVRFWLVNKDLGNIEADGRETVINSIVLGEEIDRETAAMKKYSIEMIERILSNGLTMNTLFHDVSWINELRDCLIPIGEIFTVKRGERRGWNELFYPGPESGIESEYIKPVLKNPSFLKSFTARTDITAFCCHKSKEELREAGHTGALRWIEKFENIKNGTGKALPAALKRSGCYWYEMDDATKADFVTALNPDKRLFVAKFDKSTFVDQRFTRMLFKDTDVSADLLHALLNSLYGMFAIEAIGFGRGLGVLDASSTKLKKMYMINPRLISEKDAEEIVNLFNKMKDRNVMDTENELRDSVREEFDRKVLAAIGHGNLYERIKNSLLSMQHTRHTVNE